MTRPLPGRPAAALRRSPVPLCVLVAGAGLASCGSTGAVSTPPPCPVPGGRPADELIEEDEEHFAHLWQITRGGENAEGYFSFDGARLVFQRRNPDEGIDCDRIFVTGSGEGHVQVSDGSGVTTCSYFLPSGDEVVYASTRGGASECPPRLDYSEGYVWPIWPEYDLWVRHLGTGELRRLTDEPGYDAEATVSPLGDRIVFTSTRSGDLELWTCALDGSDLVQVTDEVGYDGGGFFSHDGRTIVFRTTAFTPGQEESEQATYMELVRQWRIRPHSMELMLVDADGSNRRQLTRLGGANFAPFFYPGDRAVIFSTNHSDPQARNFDLYRIGVDGSGLERITTYKGFDSFPMFDPSGRYLAFASNRGGTKPNETNLFVAEWR